MCPKNCFCEETSSVQCFRVQSVQLGISKDLRKINLGYSHLKELKNIGPSKKQVETPSKRSSPWPGSLQESSLVGLKKLRILHLQNNQISTLRASTLSLLENLESLYLDGNKIKSIHGAPRLPTLNIRSMGSNSISSIPSAFFSSMHLLKILDLSSNHLTKIPHGLPQSLIHLKLDRNQIQSLRNRDMYQMRNLVSLGVSFNKLISVDTSLRLPSLSVCELAGNKLRELPGSLGSKLENLDCRQNNIQEVTYQQLAGMNQLKHLFLENNTIRNFEAGAFRNCMQLSNLALEQNLLSAIPYGLPETLVRLDLKENNIETIHEPKHVEISPDFCREPVHASLEEWRAYLLAQETCERQTKNLLVESKAEHKDKEE
ncbi:Nephrocan [Triplophysa tibetana]|uniref:Nephrocan n=1 Tax=Triplophysa tibetana TaxID=1572043 RepID=A0A5A9NJI1_9TELE|nr:Nephrocan [Triplophysa tibetana]